MLRRLSLLLALGLGCAALAWGLFYLHGIFVEERDDALGEIAARRRALEQFAHKELEQRLREQLSEARPTIDAASRDPLIPASKMWLVDRGQQLLPRTAQPLAGGAKPATELFELLNSTASALALERARHEDPDAPWAQRLMLLEELKLALRQQDRQAIESSIRQILSLRAAYVISVTRDIPYTVAVLSLLQAYAQPRRSLMEALLREGLSGRASRLEGLQRALLNNRPRFSQPDLKFLQERIVALCEPHNVLYSDFAARIDEGPGETLALPADLGEPVLLYGGRWYVEPARNGRVYGVVIKVAGQLDEITSSMRERALLGPEDEVRGDLAAATVAVAAIDLQIDSPDFQPAIDQVHGRYRLKAALEFVIALLVFGVMALAAWIYRRRHLFLELKSDFVSAVSHELRTPLASIRLMAETLERRTKDLPKARDYPTRIIHDVDGLSFLVENILSFNRLSRGRWKPKLEQVKLASIVDKLDRDRDSWARRPAELSHEGLEAVELHADPDLLQLLLTNLARNSCQYNEREPARIHLEASREGRGWLLRLSDNGIGIPEGERARVFDDFYRAAQRKEGRERGSGLGLSICRKIMEAHGGSIRIAHTGEEGTTFELSFPANKAGR